MRVLIIGQHFPPETTAAATRGELFARTLAEDGHEVTVITAVPNHPHGRIESRWKRRLFHRSTENGHEVVRVLVYASENRSFARRLVTYLTFAAMAVLAALRMFRNRPDVVLATSPPLFVLWSGAVAAKALRRPFVADVRDLWPDIALGLGQIGPGRIYETMKLLERWCYRSSDLVTAVTRPYADHIAARGGRRVEVIANGTIPELFDPERLDPEITSMVRGEADFVLGYTGNIGLAQGVDAVVPAARELAGEGLGVFLLGEGPHKPDLETACQGLSNVRFHDPVPLAEVTPFINACDAMLVPLAKVEKIEGTVPSKLFDYMCCGKPIILMVEGEAKRILTESGGGIAVPPGDAEALAAALRELTRDPERAAEMGRRGREHVLANFVRADQARELERLLAELVLASA